VDYIICYRNIINNSLENLILNRIKIKNKMPSKHKIDTKNISFDKKFSVSKENFLTKEKTLVKCCFGECDAVQHQNVCDKHKFDVLIQNHFC
jgi:hypothetical protein